MIKNIFLSFKESLTRTLDIEKCYEKRYLIKRLVFTIINTIFCTFVSFFCFLCFSSFLVFFCKFLEDKKKNKEKEWRVYKLLTLFWDILLMGILPSLDSMILESLKGKDNIEHSVLKFFMNSEENFDDKKNSNQTLIFFFFSSFLVGVIKTCKRLLIFYFTCNFFEFFFIEKETDKESFSYGPGLKCFPFYIKFFFHFRIIFFYFLFFQMICMVFSFKKIPNFIKNMDILFENSFSINALLSFVFFIFVLFWFFQNRFFFENFFYIITSKDYSTFSSKKKMNKKKQMEQEKFLDSFRISILIFLQNKEKIIEN